MKTMRFKPSGISKAELEEIRTAKKYPCHWDNTDCSMFECFACDKQIRNMEKGLYPREKKQLRNRGKACSHSTLIHPKIDVCPECGEVRTDLEYMGYFIPEKYLKAMIEGNKKRSNLSELEYRKKVNPEGTVKSRLENGD